MLMKDRQFRLTPEFSDIIVPALRPLEATMGKDRHRDKEIEARFLVCGDNWRGEGTGLEIWKLVSFSVLGN